MSDNLPKWLRAAYAKHGSEVHALIINNSSKKRVGWRKVAKLTGLSERKSVYLRDLVESNGAPGSSEELEYSGPNSDKAGPPSNSAKADAPAEYSTIKELVEDSGGQLNREVYVQSKGIYDLASAVKAAGLNEEEWIIKSWTSKAWQGFAKTADGPEIVQMHGIRFNAERRFGPAHNGPVQVKKPLRRKKSDEVKATESVLCIPDSQHGYRWSDNHDYMIPLHDRVAFDAIVQVAADMKPDHIVLLGDMLDLAPWSTRFARPQDLMGTTNAALHELHWQIAQLRLVSPTSKIYFLEGNHEQRINRALVELMPEAPGIKRVGEKKEAMSVERLLALDELDVEYIGPYGEGMWMWKDQAKTPIWFTHGDVVRAGGGSTAAAILKSSRYTQIYGHIHRVEHVAKTIHGHNGPETIHAMSPGCLCNLTPGVLPGSKRANDWNQAVSVGYLDAETGDCHYSIVMIENGRMFFDGKGYQGRDRSVEIAEFCGYPAMVSPELR